MTSEADLLALPYHYEYKGKVYRISRIITFGMEAAFADWVFSEAINNVERLRAKYAETLGESGLNPEQYENAMNRLYDKLASGDFAWGSQIVVDKANKTWDGGQEADPLPHAGVRPPRLDGTARRDLLRPEGEGTTVQGDEPPPSESRRRREKGRGSDSGGVSLTRKQIFILLADKGKTREEIRDLDIHYANEILFPERDEHGQPAFIAKLKSEQDRRRLAGAKAMGASNDPADQYRRILWIHGWPKYKIDAIIERMKEERQTLLREAGVIRG